MCELAKKQGEAIIHPQVTCNWRDENVNGDGVRSLGVVQKRISCDDRLYAFHGQNASWGQIERDVNEEDVGCGSRFLYGIMLRAPEDLMASFVGFNRFNATATVSWLLQQRDRPDLLGHPCSTACKHYGHQTLSWQLFATL